MRQRPSCVEATSGVHLSAPRSPQKKKKPPGTETPVNSGNKKMIKSDLMSRRRQAKTHICHSKTDVTAPPAHFSLPPSLTRSHSSSHSFIHYTLMFSPIEAPDRTAPAPRSLPSGAFKSHAHSRLPVASAFNHLTHTHNLLLTFSTGGIGRDYFHMKQDKARRKLLTDGLRAERKKNK